MMDAISGEEPPVELGEEVPRSFGGPHVGWFFAAVALQLVVLLFMGASKLHAMPPAKIVKVEALSGYVSRDKFRGHYVTTVIFNDDALSVLPSKKSKEVVLIFDTDNQVSTALDTSLANWKSVRIESTLDSAKNLKPSEVGLKAKVGPSMFKSGKQMIFVNSSPFFMAESAAIAVSRRETISNPVRFQIAVDKNGGANVIGLDSAP